MISRANYFFLAFLLPLEILIPRNAPGLTLTSKRAIHVFSIFVRSVKKNDFAHTSAEGCDINLNNSKNCHF